MVLTTTQNTRLLSGGANHVPACSYSLVKRGVANPVCFSHIRTKCSIRHDGARTHRRGQGRFVNRHPQKTCPVPKLGLSNFRGFVRKSAIAQSDIVSLIGRLLTVSRPSAIRRLVIPVAVYAVYRKSVFVAVGKSPITKDFIACVPLRMYRYAPAAVVLPADVVWVGASVAHPRPYFEQPLIGIAVDGRSLPCNVNVVAAAGLGVAVAKPLPKNDKFLPAFAPAPPSGAAVYVVLNSLNHCESSKYRAGDVDKCCVFSHELIIPCKRREGWA